MILYDTLLLYSDLYGVWPQYVGVTCLFPRSSDSDSAQQYLS